MNDFNNRGILFKNGKKWRPKHPDFTGEATISGRKFKMAAWAKQGRKGEFYSVAFSPEEMVEPESTPQSETPPKETPQDYAF